MRTFKPWLLGIIAAVMCMFSVCYGQTGAVSLGTIATQIRTSAILTTSDVLGTTFTIDARAKAVVYYVDWLKGSSTNAILSPCGAMDGNPVAGDYKVAYPYIATLTSEGKYCLRVPREQLGAYLYGGAFLRCTGTATGTTTTAYVKFEY